MDDAEWEHFPQQSSKKHTAPLLVSTASHIRVSYFARLSQISHLLGLVLNAVYNPTPDSAFNAHETAQLRKTLAVYAELLPKEASAVECEHYCGVIMICQRFVHAFNVWIWIWILLMG